MLAMMNASSLALCEPYPFPRQRLDRPELHHELLASSASHAMAALLERHQRSNPPARPSPGSVLPSALVPVDVGNGTWTAHWVHTHSRISGRSCRCSLE